ncbi:hypothetical protein AAWM_04366 [Aspergillus awamori]|uniref:Uncharacterized protein n=1 Tax=Aspergillus awamori TaxID=105351 RepID=A0A401KQE2_ASPAW|nr:hypothetical protein AAWM_04366 [Aspergillus awamori]
MVKKGSKVASQGNQKSRSAPATTKRNGTKRKATRTETPDRTAPSADGQPENLPETREGTETQELHAPVDENEVPLLPRKRVCGQRLLWTRPDSLDHHGVWREDDVDLKTSFQTLERSVCTWTNAYCHREPGLKRRLSASEIEVVLDGLGGFCLYKDWGSIEKRLDEKGLNNFWIWLPSAVLMKHLFEDVIANPFVYVKGDRTNDQSSMGPPGLGQELYELWQKLVKVDPARATVWRTTTTQLLNMVHPEHTNDWKVACQTGEAKESLANNLATGMLAECKALQVLLQEVTDPDTTKKRYEALVEVYRVAIDITVYIGTVKTEFEFQLDVNRCGPYLHRLRRVRKQGCSDENLPDKWPVPVLLYIPLVAARRIATSLDVECCKTEREDFWQAHESDRNPDLQKQLDDEIPEMGFKLAHAVVVSSVLVFVKGQTDEVVIFLCGWTQSVSLCLSGSLCSASSFFSCACHRVLL